MNVLEITPYEPPASGWVSRIKLLRRLIEEREGRCEILDIGPNRLLERPGCISVKGGLDYLAKVIRFSRQGFIIHSHINGEYFRGLLLALIALFIGRIFNNRCVVTFHGGTIQPFLIGWRRHATSSLYRIIFFLAHATVCNSESVKNILSSYQAPSKIFTLPAFSCQYLEYRTVILTPPVDTFINSHSPLISTYLCFRDGFFTDVVVDAIGMLTERWPTVGLVVVGTGDNLPAFMEVIERRRLENNIIAAGDLDHDAFMTLIKESTLHLRTPVTDGISSTVLEALSLKIPVVASENGNRPASVITYQADDPKDLSEVIHSTLEHHREVVDSIVPPEIADTASDEVNLILGIKGQQEFAKGDSKSFRKTGQNWVE